MAHSIPGVLAMQMFGVPLVGADICGFNGDTTEELCARWMALGAFSPFARNHNAKDPRPQEPYLWPSVAAVSSLAIKARYSLLHVYNTLFFRVNQQGGTVMRPLYFNFAQDPNTFAIGEQLMLGSVLLITPVLTQGATQVTGYFPPTNDAGQPQRWYSCWTLEELSVPSYGMVTLDAPLSTIPLHLAGGSILPMQQPANTINAQLGNPLSVMVALDSAGAASGELFMDDGSTLAIGTNSLQSTFSMAGGVLSYAVQRADYAPAGKLLFVQIQVLGVSAAPKAVKVNGQTTDFKYDSAVRTVTLTGLTLPLNQPFQAAFAF
jgi:alpha-glucosidase (family GH31 glycosyl hydrolase)